MTDNMYAQEVLTADAVESFLRQNETIVLVENGGTYLSRLTGTPGKFKC